MIRLSRYSALLTILYSSLVWPGTPPAESLAQHDAQVLKIYNRLKRTYTQKTDPLIIAWGNKLDFYHQQTVHEYPIIPANYDELKSISHVILAVYALFDPKNEFPKNMADVIAYKNLLISTEPLIQTLPLSPDQKKRQQHILAVTKHALTEAIEKKAVSQHSIQQLFSTLSPLIQKNMDDAAKLEIDAINQQMTKIQHQLTPEELKQLFVVIPTSKMPRQDNLIGQYFSKFMNAPMDSDRLIYAEGLTKTKQVLALVGSWQMESNLSLIFFHNANHMKKDILGTSTQHYLQQCTRDTTQHSALVCDHTPNR